ncbi:tetratricopeptide repeat protein [bacterium]|nr:tetratricopeptide repeat protein [candidate division CSSED10-310 bacterium]
MVRCINCFAVIWMLVVLTGLHAQEIVWEYTQYEPGKTWMELAMECFAVKDYNCAIDYMERWLHADPGDATAWYNLACAYALSGQTDKALDAFEKSVDSGYRDHAHAMVDTDLESIRSEPRFLAAVERAKMVRTGPVGFIRRVLPMESLGTYIVALPTDYETSGKSYPVCLILHGHGSTELNHGALADEFGREGVIYVCPRAPYAFAQLMMFAGKEGYTAWPQLDLGDDEKAHEQVVTQYVEWIFACAADVQKLYRCTPGRIYIFGHSQGAGYANLCALLHPNRVKSYFSYAGYLDDSVRDIQYFRKLKRKGVKPYIVHCTGDTVLPPERSQEIIDEMKKAGVNYRYIELEGDHGINDDVVNAAREWVKTEIRSEK